MLIRHAKRTINYNLPTNTIFKRSVHNDFFRVSKQSHEGITLIRELFGEDSEMTHTAINLFHNTYLPRYSEAHPMMKMNLALENLNETNQKIAKYLENNRDFARKFSLMHMHIPGLHSIIMDVYPEVLFRLYVIPPNQVHASHADWSQPFLRHPHRYDFISLPLVGSLLNQRSMEIKDGPKIWNKYRFSSAVTNDAPVLQTDSKVSMRLFPIEQYTAGQAYMMQYPEIHRAGFIPDDSKNDWSIVFFLEFRDQVKETPAYSRHLLSAVPEYEKLYKKPTEKELDQLLDSIISRLRMCNATLKLRCQA